MTPSTSSSASHADDWVRRLLDAARERLGMDVAWLSVFTEETQEIRVATGALDAMGVRQGMHASLEGSFCVRVLSGQLPPVVTAPGGIPGPATWR
ncbi:hypothetical protein A7K94_0216370 [Modestobacter sp. VKM Ac-2676]|nr:hypothetical protein A7K94_0216370 [Modestobacter sp. VKM Ac-2676]